MPAEYLVIDGWSSETPAWTCLDYTPLKQPADQRGADLVVPGSAGVLAYPRRNTVTEKLLPFHIFGDTDPSGHPYADAFSGLQANIDQIISSIVEPVASSTGTRSAVWHLPDGTTRSAAVHVLAFPLNRVSPVMARAVLKISIPAGRFS